MAERSESATDSVQRALHDALATMPQERRRPRDSSPRPRPDEADESPAAVVHEVHDPAVAEPPVVTVDLDQPDGPADLDQIVWHLTFQGSFIARRFDELERRIDALTKSIESLRAELRASQAPPAS